MPQTIATPWFGTPPVAPSSVGSPSGDDPKKPNPLKGYNIFDANGLCRPYNHGGGGCLLGAIVSPIPGTEGYIYHQTANGLEAFAFRKADITIVPIAPLGSGLAAMLQGRVPAAPAARDKDSCSHCGHKPVTRYSSFNSATGVRDPWWTCSGCGGHGDD